jgi:hypothetical protein
MTGVWRKPPETKIIENCYQNKGIMSLEGIKI